MSLPTNFKDDLLDTSRNVTRVYDIVDSNGAVINSNVHLVDRTSYLQEGTEFSAQDINNIALVLNSLTQYFDNIEVVDSLPAERSARTLYLSKE